MITSINPPYRVADIIRRSFRNGTRWKGVINSGDGIWKLPSIWMLSHMSHQMDVKRMIQFGSYLSMPEVLKQHVSIVVISQSMVERLLVESGKGHIFQQPAFSVRLLRVLL